MREIGPPPAKLATARQSSSTGERRPPHANARHQRWRRFKLDARADKGASLALSTPPPRRRRRGRRQCRLLRVRNWVGVQGNTRSGPRANGFNRRNKRERILKNGRRHGPQLLHSLGLGEDGRAPVPRPNLPSQSTTPPREGGGSGFPWFFFFLLLCLDVRDTSGTGASLGPVLRGRGGAAGCGGGDSDDEDEDETSAIVTTDSDHDSDTRQEGSF